MLLCCLWLWAWAAAHAHASSHTHTHTHDHAQAATAAEVGKHGADGLAGLSPPVNLAVNGVTLLDGACVVAGVGERPPANEAAWLHTTLPHEWRDTHPAYQDTLWYRFRVRLDQVPTDTWAIYLPRAVMNAQVWVNGVAMAYTGSMVEPVTRNWYVPLLVNVPTSAWQQGENTIYVRVAGGHVARNGLAPIEVGPAAQLVDRQGLRRWVQADGVLVASIGLFALGIVMAIVWLRDRDQVTTGYVSAAALMWSAGTAVMVTPNPLAPLALWENLAFFLVAWSLLMLCLYYYRYPGGRVVWPERLAQLMFVAAPAAALVLPSMATMALVFLAIYVLMLGGFVRAGVHIVRHRIKDGLWLTLGAVLAIGGGAHDVAIQLGWAPFDAVYVLPFIAPLNVCCIFISLAGDYSRSRRALAELNRTLTVRVAQRERELRDSFSRLAAMERAQAVSAERSRILKDMHDGVGAHLSSALRQLQSSGGEPVDLPMVTQTLRDSLDQLKLSIDAMHLQPGDVVGLLASMRFRMTPRLKAAGIELIWDVPELSAWPLGTPPVLRHLQYILFEGLSNVLQHAGATRLVLTARLEDGLLLLSLIDNGCGLSDERPSGQGMQSLAGRAAVIGARLSLLRPAQGGLELRLTLPWQASDWRGLSSAA